MNHLSLSLFGTFQATLGDKRLTRFRSAKAQGLLIYLALTAPQAHGRDVLAALFWPDEPDKIAKQNLRQALYLLRKLLANGQTGKRQFLRITRATVQFDPDSSYRLDVADFLAALARGEWETAVSYYQGDLLAGFAFDSRPFDEWLRQEREQYHRQAVDALNTLTSYSLSRADFPTAERFARQQLRLEPWREEAHRLLMQALALQGERSAALAQFETCQATLEEELGVAPTAKTVMLAQRIREAEVAQPKRPSRQRFTIPFAGRAAEFEGLVEAYWRLVSDGVQLVTLMGKAGMGKTRLAHHFAEWAATQGADVLVGCAFETSAGLSYQPIITLLRPRLEHENAPEDLLSDLWLSQLTRLLPELRERYPDLPEPTQEENTARQHLFEAITRLLQALAERRPLLLFIDDWHWADSASLDVLHYAAVRWAQVGAPIMVLLTLRQEAVDELPDVQSWLNKFNHAVETRPFQLNELSKSETAQLLQQLLVPETKENQTNLMRFNAWLFAETDGQPLFLAETLKSLAADGLVQPGKRGSTWRIDWQTFDKQRQTASGRLLPQVQQLIRGWLDRITAPARELLTAAAVLDHEITFDHLCYLAALDQFEALTALDELLGQQLLLEAGEPSSAGVHEPQYSFSHQKVSAMVYTEAGAARRRLLHRRAYEVLQAGAASAADCAHHARNAGLVTETIHHSLRAGNEAMALFAFGVAITHLETAYQLTRQTGWPETISDEDRQALYSQLGRANELINDWDRAKETYAAMIADAEANDAPGMACIGFNRLATIHFNHHFNSEKAMSLLREAEKLAMQSDDQRGLAETEWNLSLVARRERGPQAALYHGERAMKFARSLAQPPLLARCLSLLSYVNTTMRRWEAAEAYAEESRQLYMAVGNFVLAADSQRTVGWCQMISGRPRDSLATLQETLRFSQRIENLWGEADCSWKLTLTQLELGDYGEAIRLAQRALEQTQIVGHPPLALWATLVWGIVQRTTMQLDAAKETYLRFLREAPKITAFTIISEWPLAELSVLHGLTGDWERACDCARQILELPNDDSLLPQMFTGWYETEALLRGGEEALARAEIERVARIVGDNKRYQLSLLRSRAVLAQWDGDRAQAVTHLENALTLAQEIGLPGEEWPILGELGKLYAERGEEVKAKQAYKEAGDIIRQLAETIDDEVLRAGFLTATPIRSVLAKNAAIQ